MASFFIYFRVTIKLILLLPLFSDNPLYSLTIHDTKNLFLTFYLTPNYPVFNGYLVILLFQKTNYWILLLKLVPPLYHSFSYRLLPSNAYSFPPDEDEVSNLVSSNTKFLLYFLRSVLSFAVLSLV